MIDLCHNDIDDQGEKYLLEALEVNSSLLAIDIISNSPAFERNREIHERARKGALTLLMIREFRRGSIVDMLDKGVVRMIAVMVYDQRLRYFH